MSYLRILALGDAHFQVNNIREVNIFLSKLEQYLLKNNFDIICILGDSLHFHGKLHTTPLNKVNEYVNLCSKFAPTYIVAGNHDMENNTIFLTDHHWLNCLKGKANITVVDNVIIRIFEKNNKISKIVFCPYITDGRFIEALNTRKGEWEDANCIFSHVTIKDCKMGSIIAKDADEWKEYYPMLVSGHIHESQWIGKNMYYSGSIFQVDVNEDPNKYITLVTITDDKLPKIEQIDLVLPKKKILHVDISEIDDYIVPNEPETTYTIYISGSHDEYKGFRRSTKYKDLQKHPQVGLKNIKFHPNKADKKEKIRQIEELQKYKQKNFSELLIESIKLEKEQSQMKLMLSLLSNLLDDSEDLSADLENMLVI